MRTMGKKRASSAAACEQIVEDVVAQGFSVYEGFIGEALVHQLVADTRILWEQGEFESAKVGHGAEKQSCPTVRSDRIHWLEPDELSSGQARYTATLEKLRLALNRATMVGLFEWEGHLAIYPAGSFYRRHLDVFRHARERKLSTILYLNEGWTAGDGGELRFYLNGTNREEYVDIAPRAGTLVTFWSEQFYHEVLVAHQERMSITGWFRSRS